MTDAGLTTLRRGTDVSAPRSSSAFDIPNVERFCTYKQSLDYVRRYCGFLSAPEKDRILQCGACRVRSHACQGAEPLPCVCRRREGGRAPWRQGESEELLRWPPSERLRFGSAFENTRLRNNPRPGDL
jgi:hypothetical protein